MSLVRPPNTTIPKTLAALPRSQYATVLDDVSGKDDDELFLFCPAASPSLDCAASPLSAAAAVFCRVALEFAEAENKRVDSNLLAASYLLLTLDCCCVPHPCTKGRREAAVLVVDSAVVKV